MSYSASENPRSRSYHVEEGDRSAPPVVRHRSQDNKPALGIGSVFVDERRRAAFGGIGIAGVDIEHSLHPPALGLDLMLHLLDDAARLRMRTVIHGGVWKRGPGSDDLQDLGFVCIEQKVKTAIDVLRHHTPLTLPSRLVVRTDNRTVL